MNPDGSFSQVEITTQGAGDPLPPGVYPAALCCNLYNPHKTVRLGNGNGQKSPNITQDAEGQYITAISDGTVIAYKYFLFQDVHKVALIVRGADGRFDVSTAPGKVLGSINLTYSEDWRRFEAAIPIKDGIMPLYFTYQGKGKAQLKTVEIW
jgi:hypothetical protein